MITTTSLTETYVVAADFVQKIIKIPQQISDNNSLSNAIVVGFYGDLGAGKTAFIQGIAKALGVESQVVSPTFVLEKIYKLNASMQERFTHLVHIDAYRMDDPKELVHIGWHDLLKDSRNLICIEWPERVASEMPQNHIHITCGFVDDTTHTYDIQLS